MGKLKQPELSELARELMTPNGLLNAYADLVRKLRIGGTRDEVTALTAEKSALKPFAEAQVEAEKSKNLVAIQKELRETQKLMKQDHGGAKLSYDTRSEIPIESSTEVDRC